MLPVPEQPTSPELLDQVCVDDPSYLADQLVAIHSAAASPSIKASDDHREDASPRPSDVQRDGAGLIVLHQANRANFCNSLQRQGGHLIADIISGRIIPVVNSSGIQKYVRGLAARFGIKHVRHASGRRSK